MLAFFICPIVGTGQARYENEKVIIDAHRPVLADLGVTIKIHEINTDSSGHPTHEEAIVAIDEEHTAKALAMEGVVALDSSDERIPSHWFDEPETYELTSIDSPELDKIDPDAPIGISKIGK